MSFPTLNGGRGVCVGQRLMTLIAIIAILLAHEDLIRVALPLPPVQCCLQTVKAPIRKEFGQIVLSNIEWGKGVCVGQRLMN